MGSNHAALDATFFQPVSLPGGAAWAGIKFLKSRGAST
jgi:hypothetical protein